MREIEIEPAALLEHLRRAGSEVTAHFRGDDLGWFRAELAYGGEAPIELERYLVKEERIRGEINSWAAWLETLSDQAESSRLMQRVVSTVQLITLCPPAERVDDEAVEQICWQACVFLANETDGLIQIDGRGFVSVEGDLLVPDDSGGHGGSGTELE